MARLRRFSFESFGPSAGRLAHLIAMSDYTALGLDQVLTTSELADYLHVKPQVIYDLRRAGDGPRGYHVGKELRYCVPEIRAWLESRADPLRGSAAHAR